MGESAIDVFTERGASVVFQSLHTIISTCSAIEPETGMKKSISNDTVYKNYLVF